MLISDGEVKKGQLGKVLIHQNKLDNLIIIVDYNKLQALSALKDALPLNNLVKNLNRLIATV